MKSTAFLFLLFVPVSCSRMESANKPRLIPAAYLKTIDTTIIIKNVDFTESGDLNSFAIIRAAVNHFRNKGAKTEAEISDYSKSEIVIYIDTCYLFQNRNCSVIRYRLKPIDINGTCVQSDYATVSNTGKGLTVANEEFLPSGFYIDSIAENNIYGYDWDCSDHKKIANRIIRVIFR